MCTHTHTHTHARTHVSRLWEWGWLINPIVLSRTGQFVSLVLRHTLWPWILWLIRAVWMLMNFLLWYTPLMPLGFWVIYCLCVNEGGVFQYIIICPKYELSSTIESLTDMSKSTSFRSRSFSCSLSTRFSRFRHSKSEGRGFDSRWCHWSFLLTSLKPRYGPGVDSVSNRNEYNEYLLRVKAVGAYSWCFHLHVTVVSKSGCPHLLEPPGSVHVFLIFFFYYVGMLFHFPIHYTLTILPVGNIRR